MVIFQIIELLNYPMILFLGIMTTYQDLKYNKIKNKWIILALVYSFITLISMVIFMKLNNNSINQNYLKLYLLNLVISLTLGFVLWLAKLWSAGDAKLFLAFAALVPLETYKWGNIGNFPSYIILINTFTPIFIFYIVKVFVKTKLTNLWKEIKIVFEPKQLFNLIIFLFGFSLITVKLTSVLGLQPSFFTNIIMLLFIFLVIKKLLKDHFFVLGLICTVLRLIFDNITSNVFIKLLSQLGVFLFLRLFISLGFYIFSKPVYIESLKPGMSLAEDITKKGKEYYKEKDTLYYPTQILFKKRNKDSIFSNYHNLAKKDVNKINKLHSQGKIKDHIVYIKEKIPFAVFLFIGVIITLLVKGNFLVLFF